MHASAEKSNGVNSRTCNFEEDIEFTALIGYEGLK